MLKKLIRYAGFPFIFIFPLTVYAITSANGNAPVWAMISSVMAVSILMLWEKYLPSRIEWQPNWKHVKVDLQYLTLVHLALSELIGAGVALFLVSEWGTKAPLVRLWPHKWPVWEQVLLVILIADFLQYWAHRAMHGLPILWRLHAVHHSVDRLYSFNTLRFHPLEMLQRYISHSLPFVLLGVDPRVFGFWIVIHLLSAFTQHCNVNFYFGLLSRIVITPELHRWHHAMSPEESTTNYAPAFCLWDIVFGTYCRPKGRQVGELGIQGAVYPSGFFAQIRAPFIKLEK